MLGLPIEEITQAERSDRQISGDSGPVLQLYQFDILMIVLLGMVVSMVVWLRRHSAPMRLLSV
jgi:hypothetical protein